MDGSRVITLESRIEAMKAQIEEAKANLYARQGALAAFIELKNASEAEFKESILTPTPTDARQPMPASCCPDNTGASNGKTTTPK